MTKISIKLQHGEYIARHLDHVGIIGVGDTEQEALQELAEALGALAYSLNVVAKKKDELFGLYQQYYNKIPIGTSMYKVEQQIEKLEKELEEVK